METRDAARRLPLLQDLSTPDLERIEGHASVRTLKKGAAAWQGGRPCEEMTFVVTGHLKLQRQTEEGRPVIVDVLGPGQVACSTKPVLGDCYCCTAVALEANTRVLAVPRSKVNELIDESPRFAATMLRNFARDTQSRCGRIEEQSAGSVEQRVARLLSRLAETEGEPLNGDGTLVRLKLSRQDLASLCGTTIETAIRTISKLRSSGVIREVTGGFVIPNREVLAAIARAEHHAC